MLVDYYQTAKQSRSILTIILPYMSSACHSFDHYFSHKQN